MAKRKLKTLTEKLRSRIREDHASLKISDFQGEALAYLRQVKQLAKARNKKAKKKADSTAKIEELEIPKDSELYQIVSKGAKLKGITVKQFVKKYRKEIEGLMKDGDFVVQRETEYLISDVAHMKSGTSVFVNDGNGYRKTPKKRDIFDIQTFTQHIMSNSDIFLLVYRVHYKLNGDLSHYLPDPEEYEDLFEEEELMSMLDEFYPYITYLKSGKKDAPKVETVIEPDAKERKKKGGKGKSDNGSKRKGISKTSKGK